MISIRLSLLPLSSIYVYVSASLTTPRWPCSNRGWKAYTEGGRYALFTWIHSRTHTIDLFPGSRGHPYRDNKPFNASVTSGVTVGLYRGHLAYVHPGCWLVFERHPDPQHFPRLFEIQRASSFGIQRRRDGSTRNARRSPLRTHEKSRDYRVRTGMLSWLGLLMGTWCEESGTSSGLMLFRCWKDSSLRRLHVSWEKWFVVSSTYGLALFSPIQFLYLRIIRVIRNAEFRRNFN